MATQIGTQQDELLTVTEAAAYLKVTQSTMTKWARQGVVPAYKFGKVWRVSQGALDRLMSEGRAS